MRTEVKFRELPEKVRYFIKRLCPAGCHVGDSISIEWLHNLPDWTEATDEERLAYVEWRYPVGTIAIDVDGDSFEVTEKPFILNNICKAICLRPKFKGGVVWDNESSKWSEILSTPDEVKEPLFKVGDRPKWTPELIKELPNGTVLKSVYVRGVFTYAGQSIEKDVEGDLKISHYFDPHRSAYFTHKNNNEYAEIVSLPDIKEASPSAQQEFVKANPGMSHVEEFQAGEIVEARIDGWPETDFRLRRYLCKNSFGKFVCEYTDGSVERFDEIRKTDPDRELKEMADEVYGWILSKYPLREESIPRSGLKRALIEMGNKVKSKNK